MATILKELFSRGKKTVSSKVQGQGWLTWPLALILIDEFKTIQPMHVKKNLMSPAHFLDPRGAGPIPT